jgi:hypothetical protein
MQQHKCSIHMWRVLLSSLTVSSEPLHPLLLPALAVDAAVCGV